MPAFPLKEVKVIPKPTTSRFFTYTFLEFNPLFLLSFTLPQKEMLKHKMCLTYFSSQEGKEENESEKRDWRRNG